MLKNNNYKFTRWVQLTKRSVKLIFFNTNSCQLKFKYQSELTCAERRRGKDLF